jgi:Flp pilus assembly protein TadG
MAMRMPPLTSRRIVWESGAELVEFAFVLPVLVLVVVGIIDFGFLFQQYEVVTNAAREGARVGILPGYSTTDVQARVTSYLGEAGLSATPTIGVQMVSIPGGTGAPAQGVRVTVSYPHTYTFLSSIATWFGGSFGTTTLSAVSTMRVEVPAGT